MKKLALIEWMKLRRSSTAIAILSVFIVVIPLIYWMLTLIAIPVGPAVWKFPDSTYQAPEAYHYITYIGSWFNLMVGVIIIVFTTNEIKFRTQRQNIIDGLNKRDIIFSKFLVVFELTFIVTLYAFIVGIITNLIMGYDGNYFDGIEYIGYYFVSSLGYFSFAFLFASLLKLPALATILYIVSTFVEGIATIPLGSSVREFLPLRSFSDLIKAPILPEGNVDERIFSDPQRCLVALVYILLFFMISFWVLKKRDI
jgi:ABC-type transport system involved in multi-copper enzyme maturation permease subunit